VEEGTLVEFTRMRNAIARRMVKSKQEAPHFYVATEVEVDAAVLDRGVDLDRDGDQAERDRPIPD
jgi:pyruvate/2-oxoglutarate dehydrogenase complex dihydrolipoamide acyltransferase (E2) component